MPTIILLGASGQLGGVLAAELAARGHRFVAAGRDEERVRAAMRGLEAHVEQVRTVDVTDPRSLASALADVQVAITAVGPFELLGPPVVEACIAAGVHLVDIALEQPYVRWVYDQAGQAAWAAGVTLVPAAGFHAFTGDLLTSMAAGAVLRPSEVHVAYAIGGGLLGAASAGTRRTVATLLGRTAVALEHAELVEELPAEARRLAWFPRPVGPRHAAGIPGVEPLSVPRHLPGVHTVRTYLAMSTWRAELLQFTANAARRGPVRRRLTSLLERRTGDPDAERRAATPWACVAEVVGEDGVARAWAYGRDPAAFTAAAAVVVAGSVLAGHVEAGAVPPAMVEVPGTLLDEVSARTGARWSIARPDGT